MVMWFRQGLGQMGKQVAVMWPAIWLILSIDHDKKQSTHNWDIMQVKTSIQCVICLVGGTTWRVTQVTVWCRPAWRTVGPGVTHVKLKLYQLLLHTNHTAHLVIRPDGMATLLLCPVAQEPWTIQERQIHQDHVPPRITHSHPQTPLPTFSEA